jgi:hypothetical protein
VISIPNEAPKKSLVLLGGPTSVPSSHKNVRGLHDRTASRHYRKAAAPVDTASAAVSSPSEELAGETSIPPRRGSLSGYGVTTSNTPSAVRAGIFKAWGLSIRWRLGGARTSSHAPVHRLDEPTGISLGMVASPQCPLPFRPAKSL